MGFHLEFKDSPSEFVKKIKTEVTKNNGTHSGDEKQGRINVNSFLGVIVGDYKIEKNIIEINIIQKPLLVSEDMIKNEVKKML